jgi:hypothetical protein
VDTDAIIVDRAAKNASGKSGFGRGEQPGCHSKLPHFPERSEGLDRAKARSALARRKFSLRSNEPLAALGEEISKIISA